MSNESEKLGVSQFDGSNYSTWAYRVKIILEEKEYWDHVAEAPAAEPTAAWLKQDRKVKSLLIRCVHDNLLEVTRDCKFSHEIWEKLKATYNRQSVAKRLYLTQALFNVRPEENESLSSYFIRFDKLIREIREAGEDLKDISVIVRLMLTMPEDYKPIITALSTKEESELTLAKVKSHLLEHELRMAGGETCNNEASSHAAHAQRKHERKQQKKKLQCFTCQSFEHLQRNCPIFKENLEKQRNGRGSAAVAEDKGFAMMVNTHVSTENHDDVLFLLDSGASNHLINDKQLLTKVHSIPSFKISIAKEGETLSVSQAGTLNAFTRSNRGEEKVHK